jgi:hypothetical protein
LRNKTGKDQFQGLRLLPDLENSYDDQIAVMMQNAKTTKI